jgi:hypothetical protein
MALCLTACSSTATAPSASTTPAASEAQAPQAGESPPEPAPQTASASAAAPTTPAEAAVARKPAPSAAPAPSGSLSLNNTWADCVKGFTDVQKASARDQLLDALAVYFTTCDKVERQIVFDAPRPVPSGHDYVFESYVSFGGQLARARSKVWLSAVYHGDASIFAEHIKVAADEFRWTSPRLTFAHEGGAKIRESADLPYTKALQPVVRRIIEAKDVTVRFEGRGGHADLVVTDEMKQDLKLMMDALAALNIP